MFDGVEDMEICNSQLVYNLLALVKLLNVGLNNS